MLNLILCRQQCCFRVKSHSSPVIRSSISVLTVRITTRNSRDSSKKHCGEIEHNHHRSTNPPRFCHVAIRRWHRGRSKHHNDNQIDPPRFRHGAVRRSHTPTKMAGPGFQPYTYTHTNEAQRKKQPPQRLHSGPDPPYGRSKIEHNHHRSTNPPRFRHVAIRRWHRGRSKHHNDDQIDPPRFRHGAVRGSQVPVFDHTYKVRQQSGLPHSYPPRIRQVAFRVRRNANVHRKRRSTH